MTAATLADTLRDHDPDRFGMVMAAAPADRPKLATLYALNLELARAPFQSAEPMLAEMRLQWWADRLAEMGQGTAPPLHDVLTPLWEAWGRDAGALVLLAEARHRDCARQPFGSTDEVIAYIDATAGALMAAAAEALGGADADTVADQARGIGLASWLRALPGLHRLGLGLAGPATGATSALAAQARQALDRAAQSRRQVPRRAAPALFTPAGTTAFLSALQRGEAVECQPEPSPFKRRAALARLALTGRWWA